MIKIRIRKNYPTLNVDTDFEIEQGKFAVLFGKSGVGKTTLLNMLAGIKTPDQGFIQCEDRVWYDSEKKINLSPQERKTGYVFQDYALFPNMTIFQNLHYALGKNGEKSFIREILDITGLHKLEDLYPHQLSGGQKQRAALARAIARRPQVLLLDEPFSSLDLELRYRLQEELSKIVKNFSLTAIMATHDYSDVFNMADMVFLMESGKLQKRGKPSDVFLAEKHNNKIVLDAQIMDIHQDNNLCVLTLLIGLNILKITVTEKERQGLLVGDKITVASETFDPVVLGKIGDPDRN